MTEREITREDIADRARVDKIAPVDPKRALVLAQAIKHPWYRCQSITKVAEHLRGKDQERVLQSALKAAREQREINRIVTVSSWPIHVLATTSPGLAVEHIRSLVILAEEEPHNLRRANALQSLAYSVTSHLVLLRMIVPALVEAILGGGGPRIDRCIRETFELIGSANPEFLRVVALHHKANRQQEKLLALIPEQTI